MANAQVEGERLPTLGNGPQDLQQLLDVLGQWGDKFHRFVREQDGSARFVRHAGPDARAGDIRRANRLPGLALRQRARS